MYKRIERSKKVSCIVCTHYGIGYKTMVHVTQPG